MKSQFNCKLFSVDVFPEVFPVNTDAILLGSWASHPVPERIIELGCGCGIISLMLAQRYSDCKVYAIDKSELAIQNAQWNFSHSPWHNRLHASTCDWKDELHFSDMDMLVCNPPYYIKQLTSAVQHKNTAKHMDQSALQLFCVRASQILKKEGSIHLILPVAMESEWTYYLALSGFNLYEMTLVRHTWGSKPSLALLSYSKSKNNLNHNELLLFNKDNTRSEDFNNISGEFYLD